MDDSIQIGYLKWAVSQIQEGGGKLLTLPSDKDGQIVRRPSWIWRLHPLGGRDYRLSIRCRCPWHSMIFVGGSLYGWWNFFFFFCSFKVGERMLYFILFGIYMGDRKGIEFFWWRLFRNLKLFGLVFFFFSFLFRRFHFYLYSFGYFNEIRSSSNWYYVCFRLNIYVINFFLFLPFLFSSFLFYWFMRFINVIYPRSMFNWICKICLFFVTEARHIDKLLHQFHKCKGNKFEK